MRFRPHYGSLSLAMKECVTLPARLADLKRHVAHSLIKPESIRVEAYSNEPDDRIGWASTFVVMAEYVDGTEAPIGFTDEMPS